MSQRQLLYADLFCGAGGLSLGFRRSGFREVFAADHWDAAVATYRKNLFEGVRETLISSDIDIPAVDAIIGGPPCQGFSSAGARVNGDHRNSLVGVFSQIVARVKPPVFVFENVEGFLTAEGGGRVLDLLEPAIAAGYRIHLRKINAANYGVPQHRKRVLAIGGLGFDPGFPEPTTFAYGAPGAEALGHGLPPTPSVADALQGLPEPSTNEPGVPQGHVRRYLSDTDRKRVAHLRQGMTMRDLPKELQHESFRRRANRRVRDGTPTERRGGAPSGLRRLVAAEPSKAITGGARSEFVHPLEDRPLTIRECARLQTFPDDFEFCGNASTQMQLIGNAVPPQLAEQIAKSVSDGLRGRSVKPAPGALLSFVPTASNGMSPALRQVSEMVTQRFDIPLAPEEQLDLCL